MKLHSFWSLLCFLALISLLAEPSEATLGKSDRKKKKEKEVKKEKHAVAVEKLNGPQSSSAAERGLVSAAITAGDVLVNANTRAELVKAQFRGPGPVLGYVTPWNGAGYDAARLYAGEKIHLVSPVWLQLKARAADGRYLISGQHDVDVKWVEDLQSSGAKVLPRVLFDGWTGKDYVELFQSDDLLRMAAKTIAKTVLEELKLDGVVLELWSQLGGQGRPQLAQVARAVAEAVRSLGGIFVLVIPPPLHAGDAAGMFGPEDFASLVDEVDFFSLMTYDYSSLQRPGANAPVRWVRKCIETLDPLGENRKKILLGLNFYGLR